MVNLVLLLPTLNKSSAVVRISYSYPKFWQNNIISLGISKIKQSRWREVYLSVTHTKSFRYGKKEKAEDEFSEALHHRKYTNHCTCNWLGYNIICAKKFHVLSRGSHGCSYLYTKLLESANRRWKWPCSPLKQMKVDAKMQKMMLPLLAVLLVIGEVLQCAHGQTSEYQIENPDRGLKSL